MGAVQFKSRRPDCLTKHASQVLSTVGLFRLLLIYRVLRTELNQVGLERLRRHPPATGHGDRGDEEPHGDGLHEEGDQGRAPVSAVCERIS